jgi:hypothetical protein
MRSQCSGCSCSKGQNRVQLRLFRGQQGSESVRETGGFPRECHCDGRRCGFEGWGRGKVELVVVEGLLHGACQSSRIRLGGINVTCPDSRLPSITLSFGSKWNKTMWRL